MSAAEAKGSSFFKIFLDKDCHSKTMRIPPAFKKKMKGKKSAAVYLSGRGEHRTWQVDLIKCESGGLYFAGGGWKKFVTDHSIDSADFLIFKFDGEETFKVTIFDPTGSEKHARLLQLQEQIHHGMETESETVHDPHASAYLSPFPSFLKTMKGHNVSTGWFLDIPVLFARVCMKNCRNKTMLVLCCQGKEWLVKMLLREGKGCITTGWRGFVVDNKIKVGDICKFELQQQFRFNVTISSLIRV